MNPLAFDLLEELEVLCEAHDFEYAKSDDPLHYSSCEERAGKIKSVVGKLARAGAFSEANALLNRYVKG
jgi:hypothetical protein